MQLTIQNGLPLPLIHCPYEFWHVDLFKVIDFLEW